MSFENNSFEPQKQDIRKFIIFIFEIFRLLRRIFLTLEFASATVSQCLEKYSDSVPVRREI